MIIHCTTQKQIEDVIKTEGLILSKTDVNTLAWYVGTEKFEVCIDTKNSTWYDSRNAKSTITPYSDWRLIKDLDTYDFFYKNYLGSIQISVYGKQYNIIRDNKCVEWGEYKTGIEMFNKIKYYEEMENMKDQFIQLEGGRLNITKAKELGLFIEDKKVFTIDKDCDIKCGEYRIQSYEVQSYRVVDIFANGRTAVRLFNPTLDKLRHEFSYYGIGVDVI